MVDEHVEWKLSIIKTAAALAVLDVLDLAICIGAAYAVWHHVTHRIQR